MPPSNIFVMLGRPDLTYRRICFYPDIVCICLDGFTRFILSSVAFIVS